MKLQGKAIQAVGTACANLRLSGENKLGMRSRKRKKPRMCECSGTEDGKTRDWRDGQRSITLYP